MPKLKPVWGMFESYVRRETLDDPDVYPHTYTVEYVKEPQRARIYAECFAVYKVGEHGWAHWQLDHAPTGLHLAAADKLKDCVAKIEMLMVLDLPWAEPDREVWEKESQEKSYLKTAWLESLEATAPFEPRKAPKPKVPAAYGTLASAMERVGSYCPYAQAYRTLWEGDAFHQITKKRVEEQIRFDLAEELIDGYPSAQEAYGDIMNEESHTMRFTLMGIPLNSVARKAIMRWAKAHDMIDFAQGESDDE